MGCMQATMTRVGGMTVRMGLICGSSIGEYQILWVNDPAALLTVQGEYLVVRKNKKRR